MNRQDVILVLGCLAYVVAFVTVIVLRTPSPGPGNVAAFSLDTFRENSDDSNVMELWAFGVEKDEVFVVSVRRDAQGQHTINRPTELWRKGDAGFPDGCEANVAPQGSYGSGSTVTRIETDKVVEFQTEEETILRIQRDGRASVRPAPGAPLVEISFFGTEYSFSFDDGASSKGKYFHMMGTIGDSGWGGIELHKSSTDFGSASPFRNNWYSDWFMFYNTENKKYGFQTVPTSIGKDQGWGFAYKGVGNTASAVSQVSFTKDACRVIAPKLTNIQSIPCQWTLIENEVVAWRIAHTDKVLAWWETKK